jgi:hypothetical protein
MNHTPGPWQVVGSNVYGNNLRALLPMNAADARLIAAAPDLLAHLEFAVKLLEGISILGATAQVDAMRAVIARARGEA